MKLSKATAYSLAVILLTLASCKQKPEKSKGKSAGPDAQFQKAVAEMVLQHNAVSDWSDGIDLLTRHVYTVEIENAFAKAQGRPFLIDGTLEDISSHGGKYYLQVTPFFEDDMHYLLESDSNQVSRALAQRRGIEPLRCCLVASIQTVTKPVFETHVLLNEETKAATLRVQTGEAYLLSGTCLDLVFYPSE